MSSLNDDQVAFHGADAPVRMYVTNEDIITVPPSASVREGARAIVDASIGMLVVGTAGDVVGVVSERDIVRAVSSGLDLDRTSVSEIGSRVIVWIDADDDIADAAEEMMKDYVRHVLVRDESGFVGVLSIRDVLSAYTT